MSNIILSADSYKFSHFKAYNPEVTHMYSYIESRGGVYNKVVFFGLQAFLKEYLSKPFTREDINEADEFVNAHGLPFNRGDWEQILKIHKGFLPILITAVPEGTVVPVGNVLVTIQNTDPRFPWLTSFIETALLRAVWYPTTVATLSWHIKQDLRKELELTSDDPEGNLLFRLHDFGARGVSSAESAKLGGMAHLVNFMGSDTVEGILGARKYYNEPMAGFSIPATEHSVICSFGKEGEEAAYNHFLDKFAAKGAIIACVSDTYDLENAVNNIWGVELREKIIDSGAVLVVRPDSGDPTRVPIQTINTLGDRFGYTLNSKGFKVLNPSVRVIQGDGINHSSIREILLNLTTAGWSTENLAFGMGGALLQGVNRDTQKFAMKASAVNLKDGTLMGISKNPKTDPGKKSKEGKLALIRVDGKLTTVDAFGHGYENLLVPVWRAGELLKEYTLAEIRARAA